MWLISRKSCTGKDCSSVSCKSGWLIGTISNQIIYSKRCLTRPEEILQMILWYRQEYSSNRKIVYAPRGGRSSPEFLAISSRTPGQSALKSRYRFRWQALCRRCSPRHLSRPNWRALRILNKPILWCNFNTVTCRNIRVRRLLPSNTTEPSSQHRRPQSCRNRCPFFSENSKTKLRLIWAWKSL